MVLSKNDRRILELLRAGMIIVEEEHNNRLSDKPCEPTKARSVIRLRNRRYPHIIREATLEPGFGEFPRFRVTIPTEDGKSRRVWLSATRTVWLAHNPEPTSNNIGHIDEDSWNFDIGNLVELTQGDQNYRKAMTEGKPEEERDESSIDGHKWGEKPPHLDF